MESRTVDAQDEAELWACCMRLLTERPCPLLSEEKAPHLLNDLNVASKAYSIGFSCMNGIHSVLIAMAVELRKCTI